MGFEINTIQNADENQPWRVTHINSKASLVDLWLKIDVLKSIIFLQMSTNLQRVCH